MDFLADWTWWSMLAASVAAATAPAFFRRIRFSIIAASVLLCLAMIASMYFFNGAAGAMAGTLVTLLAGVLVLAASLIFTGIVDMLKKRYR